MTMPAADRPGLRGALTHTRAPDGTAIAWRADGPPPARAAGRAAVVLCNGVSCSDEYWGGLAGALAADRVVVRWDYRGHHRSGAPADPTAVGPEALAGDLLAVIAAADVSSVVLMGHSYGVQVALHASVTLGDRLAGFVAVAGAPSRALDGVGGALSTAVALPALRAAASLAPGLTGWMWRRAWSSPAPYWVARALGGTSPAAPRHVLDDFQRHVAELDPRQLGAMLHAMAADDATEILRGLDVPVLAVAGRRDRITPVRRMRELAATAPHGALVIHQRATHTLAVEQPEWLATQLRPLFVVADRSTTVTA